MKKLYLYCLDNKHVYIYSLIFMFFSFGFMLTNFQVRIDEETWILETVTTPRWLLQSRYGIYLFNLLFTNHGRFIPFFSSVIGMVLWCLSGLLFGYILFQPVLNKFVRTLLLSFYCTIPLTVGEMFAFSMMMIPIGIGLCGTALAFILTTDSELLNLKFKSLIIIMLLIFCSGMYQSIITFYIAAIAGWELLQILKNQFSFRILLNGVVYSISALLGYFIIDKLLVKIFNAGAYLSGSYIGWSGGDFWEVLKVPLKDFIYISFGKYANGTSVVGGISIRLVTILFLICIGLNFIFYKRLPQKFGFLLFSFGLMLSPFIINFVLGSQNIAGRMLIALSLTEMTELVVIYLTLKSVPVKSLYTGVLYTAVLVCVLFSNAACMNQLYFHASIVYQRDQATADEIMFQVEELGLDYKSKPIVFIGSLSQDALPITTSQTLGGSFFSWDQGSNIRIPNFLRTQGYAVINPSYQDRIIAYDHSEGMQPWPLEGSIREYENIIIVYLSQPSEAWKDNNLKETVIEQYMRDSGGSN